ncbi:MAG: hypothetical protein V4515_14490 [Chloroflexota bacterium]
MTQNEAPAPTTIVNSSYRIGNQTINTQLARCEHCRGRIERIVPRNGRPGIWGHEATGRAACILPADGDSVATPI